jgi:hypothetical protein
MNLFHKLLLDAERPSGDPLKNNYRSMRVYWHQVPGRFVTYIRLNDHRMYSLGVNRTKVFEFIKELYGEQTRVEMKFNNDDLKYTIHIYKRIYGIICFSFTQIKTYVYVSSGREKDFKLAKDRADVIVPAGYVFHQILHYLGAQEIHVPFSVSLRQGTLIDLQRDLYT